LGIFRALLGVAEPCVYPAGVKACTEAFAPKERALPMGIFSSGSAIGALIAAPLVAWFTIAFGWRFAFVIPGLLGLCWLPLWLKAYKPRADPAWLGEEEPRTKTPWRQLLKRRAVWGLILARLFSDPVWYFYLFWLPDYLQRARHLSLHDIAIYGWIPFLWADLGNIGGGALSDWFIRRGIAPARARLATLIAVGCLAPAGAFAGVVSSVGSAIAITCLVAFLTQVWSVNTVALAADLVPASDVGTVMGMMGTAGSMGGAMFAQLLGLLIGGFGYRSAFMVAASLHPLAILILVLSKTARVQTPIAVR
jgi:ACS family hexuronate transporter-like MFS transporter